MNVANHFITNFHYPRHIACNFPHLQKNYDKYPRLGNYGWGGPPNYTMTFNEGFYNEEMLV